MTKEYQSIVCNGYTTKKFLDIALKELTDQGFTFTTSFMGNMIIMERDNDKDSNNIGHTQPIESDKST